MSGAAVFVKIEGGEALYKALELLPAKIQRKGILDVFLKAVKIWEDEAKRRAPVDTGRLRKTIKAYRGRIRDGRVGAAVIVRPASGLSPKEQKQVAIQSIAQEFGWMNRSMRSGKRIHRKNALSNEQRSYSGQPYIRPAFEAKQAEVQKYVEDELWKIINNYWQNG